MSSDSDAKPQLVASQSNSLFSEFTAKMTEALTKVQPPTLTTEPSAISIDIKLDGTNYALWLVDQLHGSLFDGNFIRFPTAKLVWDSIATIYFDGSDTSQVYDLRHRVTQIKQARGSLEIYYNDLQGLWREIDFRRPNPMECAVDIHNYNLLLLQEDRVYVFWMAWMIN
ncbi:hypothetical protein CK203_057859 [Vitis vinifera]|uniref:Retrotransposon gag domain-containing protein n=1 Tax=Vitis vinifera TaxID=29760 RepID=A0A438GFS0_VITVI|nr:hypothetical protein CK203_057859 [Vitis vinifera]